MIQQGQVRIIFQLDEIVKASAVQAFLLGMLI
jgi:hypothetical protein